MPGRSIEDLDRRADEFVATRRRDGVLQLGQLTESLGDERCGHLAVEPGRIRAVLAAEGEEAAPVELGLLDEAEQLIVVALRLTGVADDEVAAERRVGTAGADVGDAPEEPIAVAPATHPPQQRLADVLQGQVEVRHARRRRRRRSARR